jgi:hypothetical protein
MTKEPQGAQESVGPTYVTESSTLPLGLERRAQWGCAWGAVGGQNHIADGRRQALLLALRGNRQGSRQGLGLRHVPRWRMQGLELGRDWTRAPCCPQTAEGRMGTPSTRR